MRKIIRFGRQRGIAFVFFDMEEPLVWPSGALPSSLTFNQDHRIFILNNSYQKQVVGFTVHYLH